MTSDLEATLPDARRIREEAQRYSELLELSSDAILVWRVDGGIEIWNRGAEELYGYTLDEARGRIARELLRTEFPGPFEEIQAVLKAHRRWDGEVMHRAKDGRLIAVSAKLQLVRDSDGSERIIAVNRDMTERKRTEQEVVRRNAILHNMNRIFQAALNCDTEAELGRRCLAVAEEMTQSKFGFIGEIRADGRLRDLAISDPGWEASKMEGAAGHRLPPQSFVVQGIYGRVFLTGKSVYTNDPLSHPDRIGPPPGHPPLSAFLGVPLTHDNRPIGIVAVGNREGGYRDEDQQALEALAPAIVQTLLRGRADRALRESQDHAASLARFPEENPDPVLRISANGRLLYANASARSAFGDLVLDPERDLSTIFGESVRQILDQNYQTRREVTYGERTYLIGFIPTASDVNIYAHDISERKRAEVALAVLTQLHTVLSRVNEAIVRTRDGPSLYRETCRIVAEEGGYALVWLGLVQDHTVAPVAWSRAGAQYLRKIRVEVDGELGKGPTGTCVRENRAVVNDDFERNPSTRAWRGAALGQGFRSSAAFPLHRQGKVIGAMTLYATRAGAFDSPQTKLLGALCADLSYAMDALAQEQLRADAERALKESELNLREVDRRKDAFLAVLSHELRNPLAPLQNSVYVLERAIPGGEQANRAIASIGRQTRHLARLVDDLLDVSRITRNKLRMRRTHFDFVQMTGRVIEDHKARFLNADIAFEYLVKFEPLWIDGDEQRLTQVIGNLLLNAAKFTGRGGQVTLELDADAPNKQLVIRIRDTGVGISADMLPKLFDAFIQADESLDRSEGGLGLGLAIVKGVVEMHGGHVEAASAGLGTGAEFVVRLPAKLRDFAPQHGRPRSSHPPPRRVLVIDDNADAAESLREALEFCEHEVEVAYDGPTGLKKARVFNPQVVLCDIGLPGMNGFEVARAFRSDEMLSATYLVAVTGYALPEDKRRAAEAGFDFHLAKPPSLEDIEELFVNIKPPTESGLD